MATSEVLLDQLRKGETVSFDGKLLKAIPGKLYGDTLEAGDTYVAARNVQNIFTVLKNDMKNHWIFPTDSVSYVYNYAYCVGVEVVG